MAHLTQVASNVKVADEVWIAAVLLHRENPEQADFSIEQIVERARREGLTRNLRPGVYVHVVQHCVANRPANPGRYRMLFETAPGRRRLFRKGDQSHPSREDSKTMPERSDIPPRYHELIEWYITQYFLSAALTPKTDPLLRARGSGQALWVSEATDSYVQRLREGWL